MNRRNRNKLLTVKRNYYGLGSSLSGLYNSVTGNMDSSGTVQSGFLKGMSGGASGLLSAAGSAVGQIGGSLLSGGKESGAGKVFSGLSGIASKIPGPYGAIASAALGVVGGGVNALFGSKLNQENINEVKDNISAMNAVTSDASSYDTLAENIGSAAQQMTFNKKFIGSDGVFSNKASKLYKKLKEQSERAADRQNLSFAINADNIAENTMNELERNYIAYGGSLYDGNLFGNGGKIHINPKNKGKFTAAASKAGMGVQEYASHVLANKDKYSPTLVKRANFARNAAKWHDDGGFLNTVWYPSNTLALTFGNLSNNSTDDNSSTSSENVLGNLNLFQKGGKKSSKSTKEDKAYYDFMEKIAEKNYIPWGMNSVDEALTHALNDSTYNYMEYFKNTPSNQLNIDSSNHWTDMYKTAYHPTFSNESIYSGIVSQFNPYGIVGPSPDYYERAFGGELNTQGADFTNGMLYVDEGGSHESNPLGGIPMGLDAEGTPNLVEEGETVFNDYVFSKRLNVPDTIRRKYGLSGKRELTFAEASKKLAKESEERPNDPISQAGLLASLSELAQAQEYERAKEQQTEAIDSIARNAALGGKLYDDGGLLQQLADAYAAKEIDPSKTKTYEDLISQIQLNNDNTVLGNVDLSTGTNTDKTKGYKPRSEALRYAPVLGLGIASLTDALGITNKPDYSNSDPLIAAARNQAGYKSVGFTPVGQKLTYRPLDRLYEANAISAQQAATRRAILHNAGIGNRGAGMAAVLAADNNAIKQYGEAFRKAQEYNDSLKQQIATFNRATDQFNSQGALQADTANQNAYNNAVARVNSLLTTGYAQRQLAKNASDTARSLNLSNFLTSLGNIGLDNLAWNQTQEGIERGVWGPMQDLKEKGKGGKIKRNKRKRGLTI